MPLVRIDLNKDAPAERVRIVSQAVYGALIAIANVPVNDRFQIVTRHSADEIVYPEEGYLGIRYSPDLIVIQVTWVGGRSTDVKKQFYRRIADEIHAKAGVRKEDVWINLVDNAREDWSSAMATCNTHRRRSPARPSSHHDDTSRHTRAL